MDKSLPNTIHAIWSFGFIDDEMTSIPHRSYQSYNCKFIKNDDFYESRLTLDHEDPYYQKNNSCEYGIKSSFIIREYMKNSTTDFVIATAREMPPSQLESHMKGNTFETIAFIVTDKFDDAAVSINYNFVIIKRIKILVGYDIKIPNDIMRGVIMNLRERKQQQLFGV